MRIKEIFIRNISNKRFRIIALSLIGLAIVITTILLLVFLLQPKIYIINTLEITMNGETVEECEIEVFSNNTNFGVRVNGEEIETGENLKISWLIEDESFNATINDNGSFYSGNTLGTLNLSVKAQSANTADKTIKIHIIPQYDTELQSITVSSENSQSEYIEGQAIEKNKLSVWGDFLTYSARITDFEVDANKLEPKNTELIITSGNFSTILPISVKRKTLQSIEILSAPYTTHYVEGQAFKKDGLIVQANFEYISEIIEDYDLDEEYVLSFEDEFIEIRYSYDDVTKVVTQNIDVTHRVLKSISVDDSKVQKQYTQGERFNPVGLVVFAEYEILGTFLVESFKVDDEVLKCSDTCVAVSYTENGVTQYAQVEDVKVLAPYSDLCHIIIRDPENVALNWYYSYMTDDGEIKNDNTAYVENELLFDVVNGIYDVPIGATLNLKSLNPGVIDFELDGIRQNVKYPNCFLSWKITSGNTLKIATTQMAGERILIRFNSGNVNESFLYGGSWNSALKSDDIKKLSLVFNDTSEYFYMYTVDGVDYSLSQLQNVIFNKSTIVQVTRQEYAKEVIRLSINYYENYEIEYFIESAQIRFNDLPVKQRAGYRFLYWSLIENGDELNETAFSQYLISNQEKHILYACWEKENVLYSSNLIGAWELTEQIENDTYQCNITFFEDGTFSYEVYKNQQINNAYEGLYRLNESVVTVIDLNSKTDKLLVSLSDFEFEISDDKLDASVILYDDYTVTKGMKIFTRNIETAMKQLQVY